MKWNILNKNIYGVNRDDFINQTLIYLRQHFTGHTIESSPVIYDPNTFTPVFKFIIDGAVSNVIWSQETYDDLRTSMSDFASQTLGGRNNPQWYWDILVVAIQQYLYQRTTTRNPRRNPHIDFILE